jgi:hypothetical protein
MNFAPTEFTLGSRWQLILPAGGPLAARTDPPALP